MNCETKRIVCMLAGEEGSMPAFVSNFPEAGEDESLAESVKCPGENSEVENWDFGDLRCNTYEDRDEKEVTKDLVLWLVSNFLATSN